MSAPLFKTCKCFDIEGLAVSKFLAIAPVVMVCEVSNRSPLFGSAIAASSIQ